ncbi:hypothetical protein Lal_00016684 [Lupinus albus]|nr:hypothetical protein Lal_00016684 [Lupinus albus]
MDLSTGEEGGGVLEVKHFAAELVGLGVNEDELVGEVLSENGLSNSHSDVAGADDGDLEVAFGGGRRSGVGNGNWEKVMMEEGNTVGGKETKGIQQEWFQWGQRRWLFNCQL